MSLDGFIAGPSDGAGRPLGGGGGAVLHRWLFTGDLPSRHSDFFRLSETSRDVLDETFAATGALVVGRRTYDVVEGWGGSHPLSRVPVFVLTHRPPREVSLGGVGVRQCDQLGKESIRLEPMQVIEAPGVTHLRFRVVR